MCPSEKTFGNNWIRESCAKTTKDKFDNIKKKLDINIGDKNETKVPIY